MGLLKRFNTSLTYPITATLVLVTVVPVTLAGWLFASYNREHLTTVEKLYLNRQAVSLANEVDHFFSNVFCCVGAHRIPIAFLSLEFWAVSPLVLSKISRTFPTRAALSSGQERMPRR